MFLLLYFSKPFPGKSGVRPVRGDGGRCGSSSHGWRVSQSLPHGCICISTLSVFVFAFECVFVSVFVSIFVPVFMPVFVYIFMSVFVSYSHGWHVF